MFFQLAQYLLYHLHISCRQKEYTVKHIKDYISTNAIIVLLVATPTLIAVAFWSIVNPILALVFLLTVVCFMRPFRQYLNHATEPVEIDPAVQIK